VGKPYLSRAASSTPQEEARRGGGGAGGRDETETELEKPLPPLWLLCTKLTGEHKSVGGAGWSLLPNRHSDEKTDEMASGFVKLRTCVGRRMDPALRDWAAGDVLALLDGGERSVIAGGLHPMVWSCDRILGKSNGPRVRTGDRDGVVRRVLTVAADSEDGDDWIE
jgi:hypothetical protein